ncbi:hypothetical protein DBV15_04673, partial [Temnothorax longispinosus]
MITPPLYLAWERELEIGVPTQNGPHGTKELHRSLRAKGTGFIASRAVILHHVTSKKRKDVYNVANNSEVRLHKHATGLRRPCSNLHPVSLNDMLRRKR